MPVADKTRQMNQAGPAWVSMDDGEQDAVDAAIDRVIERGLTDQGTLGGEVSSQGTASAASSRAMELLNEAQEQPQRAARPHDIWTLDQLQQPGEPIVGDLFDDGRFLFKFKPLLGEPYCQSRVRRIEAVERGEAWAWAKYQEGVQEIILYTVVEWPLRETVTDEQGNTLYEEDGTTPRTVPLPINKISVERLTMDTLYQFYGAMQRAMRGEASEQPS